MEKVIASGKNLQTAIKNGLQILNTTEDKVDYKVVAVGGLFRPCKIEIWKNLTEGDKYQEFLQTVLDKAGFDAKVNKTEDDQKVVLDIVCQDGGDIIGRRGDTLESLRYLTAISLKGEESTKQVIVDCNDYREKRIATLNKLALNLEKKVVRTNRRVKLEPMNAYERRIIHSALKDSREVETFSEGTEPYRYIVIQKKGYQKKFNNKKSTQQNKTTTDAIETDFVQRDLVGEIQPSTQQNNPKRKQLNFVYKTKPKRRF